MRKEEQVMKEEDRLSKEIIGASTEVHRHLGPGLLESAYEECLCKELEIRNIVFERQRTLTLVYKSITLDGGYKLDLVVEGKVILELKSVNKFEPIHDFFSNPCSFLSSAPGEHEIIILCFLCVLCGFA